jgi:triosephosphate isomerase (TIM)
MENHPRFLIIGNWKMHGNIVSANLFVKALSLQIKNYKQFCDIVICPPNILLSELINKTAETEFLIGAQDCSSIEDKEGAYTGEISASMLKSLGSNYVILGHSERRKLFFENNALIRKKVSNAHAAGLKAIVCIGESREQREKEQTLNILEQQLNECLPSSVNKHNTIIAYEPVWAIGAGIAATAEQIEQVHMFIKDYTSKIESNLKILYGGSVKSSNAKEILSIPFVDGALIGAASLKIEEFLGIMSITQNIRNKR